jgi:hypothetical protein
VLLAKLAEQEHRLDDAAKYWRSAALSGH